jgi:hypothetical protein
MVGSALVIVVGLCTGLVAFYNGSLPLSSSAAAASEMEYLPADATAVAFADVHHIMSSPFHDRLRQVIPSGDEKQELQKTIGVDLEKDIDTVVAGFSGHGTADQGAIVLVRGKFDQAKIEDLAKQHGGVISEYHGKKIITVANDSKTGAMGQGASATSGSGVVAFVQPGLLAFGEPASVQHAIDAGASGNNVTKNADLMKYVKGVQSGNDAWVVGRFDEVAKSASLPQDVRNQLPAVEWFSLGAKVDQTINGVVHAEARDDAAAKNLRDVINGGLAAGRMMGGKDSKFDTMINSVQVSGQGTDVSVAFTVPQEMLDMLNGAAALGKLTGKGGGN